MAKLLGLTKSFKQGEVFQVITFDGTRRDTIAPIDFEINRDLCYTFGYEKFIATVVAGDVKLVEVNPGIEMYMPAIVIADKTKPNVTPLEIEFFDMTLTSKVKSFEFLRKSDFCKLPADPAFKLADRYYHNGYMYLFVTSSTQSLLTASFVTPSLAESMEDKKVVELLKVD